MNPEGKDTREEVQIRGYTGFPWVLCEICSGQLSGRMREGTEVLANLTGSCASHQGFDLETAIHRCFRALKEAINTIYSAWNRNYTIKQLNSNDNNEKLQQPVLLYTRHNCKCVTRICSNSFSHPHKLVK